MVGQHAEVATSHSVLVETKLLDSIESMALSVEVSRLLERGAVTVVPPPESRLTLLLSLLSGSQKVRGDETHPGSLQTQRVSCIEKIPDAHSQSSAPIREKGQTHT